MWELFKKIWDKILNFVCPQKGDKPYTKEIQHVPTQKSVTIKEVPSVFRVIPSIVEAGPGDTIEFTAKDRDAFIFFPHASKIFESAGAMKQRGHCHSYS